MSDPLDAQTKQVADAYWGTNQPKTPARDIHGLGPPPRIVTDAMQRYVARAVPSLFPLWLTLAILFAFSDALVLSMAKGFFYPPIASVLFIVLAIASGRKRAQARGRIARVIVDGTLASAVVRNISQRQLNRRQVITTITYRVEGSERDIYVNSLEQVAAFLQVGLKDEVLVLGEVPEVVVPTFLLA